MKSVIIVRHAKSSWDSMGIEDFDRPLNDRGKEDAPKMAKRLIERNITINAFISSSAKRARKTAALFIKEFGGDKGSPTLAGILSNPRKLPAVPIQYLGGLSRLNACSEVTEPVNLLIILSGPEPQRTIFENLLRRALKQQPGKIVLVRGLPGESKAEQEENDLIVYNHAPAALLNQLICSSELVISRSGYTTVMDLLKLGKKKYPGSHTWPGRAGICSRAPL